jgi:hypothetical protein
MRRFLSASIAALTLATLTLSSALAGDDSIVRDVSKANDIVQLATLQHDRKTMDAMITKDFVLVLTHGAIEDHDAWLTDVADKTMVMEVNQVENLTIHPYNGDCAVAIGVLHIRAHTQKKLYDVRMRFIDVWVKQDGQWKWASSQVAHFPQPGKS